MIDRYGFRIGVGIILVNNDDQVFLARRIGQDAWQFPQGGIVASESPQQAMFRELREEVGLHDKDVAVLAVSRNWLKYRLPTFMVRHYAQPLCVGQKQKWFLLRLLSDDGRVCFDITDKPEFDGFRWVNYWDPVRRVISFKKRVYRRALKEFAQVLGV